MGIGGIAMVRHDQRPGAERHELPGEQEGEGVGGHDHEVHAGEEGWEERQDALRRALVPAVAETVHAGRGAAEIDHREEERSQRVEPEMRADPGQAERQDQRLSGAHPKTRCAKATISASAESARLAP